MASSSFSGIDVNYQASGDVACVRWYLGSQLSYDADYEAFISGSETGLESIDGTSFSVTSKNGLQAGSPAVIFVQAVSIDGNTSDVKALCAGAAPVTFTPSKVSLGSFVATVDVFDNPDYIGMGFLSMSADTPADWGMTAEEIVSLYAEYGMIDILPAGESTMVELNGEPEIAHYIGLVYWGEDYAPKDIKILDYTSGKVVSGVPEAVVDADVKNIGENAADLVFTVDENTCGYFYRLYTKAAYDETVADAPSFGYENPLDYVRDLTAAGGSMGYRSQTDSRSSLKVATDYVLVCFPYNVNGTQGYGPSVVKNFTTASPAGAPAAVSSSASDENQTVNRRAEIRKLFK